MDYTIVFVCTGNTCRSPMAQIILDDLLAKMKIKARVLSAGTHAAEGAPAAEGAVEALHEMGLLLDEHRSTLLSAQLVAEADLLLTMTEAHKDYVVASFPEAVEKTFTFKQFAGEKGDIDDPFGLSLEVYKKTAAQLQRLSEVVARRLASGSGQEKNN